MTAIVVGLPRSGTSTVAGALRDLGVHMSGTAEARKVARLLEDSGRIGALRTLIERNNQSHDVWGVEVQGSFRLLPSVLHLFRNPRVIVTFRDPVANATKGDLAAHSGLGKLLTKTATNNLGLAEMVRATPEETLVVSYEKALAAPDSLVSSLAEYCGIDVREGRRLRAIRSIKSGLESSPRTISLWYEGQLAGVDRTRVCGWARRMPANEPCVVEIVSDGVVIGRALSNGPFRSDDDSIAARGFAVELVAPPGNSLVARVAGTSAVLPATPAARRAPKRARRS